MFGRNKDEEKSPFAALDEGGTYHSSPGATVPGIPGEVEPPPQPQTSLQLPQTSAQLPQTSAQLPQTSVQPGRAPSRPPKRRARRSNPISWILFAWVIGPVVTVIVVIAVVAGAGAGSGISTGGGGGNSSAGAGAGPEGHAVSVSGPGSGSGSHSGSASSGPGSYLVAQNVTAGIARVRKLAPGSKLLLLRIDAKSLDATTIGPHGAVKFVVLGQGGTTVATGTSTGLHSLPFSAIRPAVVTKLVKQLKQRFHVPARQINYMVVLSPPLVAPSWNVFLKNGHDYLASLSGAGLHRNS